MKGTSTPSPRLLARTAGLFELLEALTSGFGQVIVPGMLVVTGDPTATAAKVLANAPLFRISIVAALIGVACHVAWTLLFYALLKPVHRWLSLLAACFGLVSVAMQAFSVLFQLTPLVVLEGPKSLAAFTIDQIQALAFLFLQISARAFHLYLVIFGVWCVFVGYLVFRSTFMPRIIGLLEMIAGLCWLTFLWLPLAQFLSPYNQMVAGLGELSMTFWLLVIGVNAQRWEAKAAALTR